MKQDDPHRRGYASPPCFAHEVDPIHFDFFAVDPEQEQDVARWRKAERARLLNDRAALSVSVRQAAAEAVSERLDALLAARYQSVKGLTISAWWPIKAELNLRHWLESLLHRGALVALPVVVTPAEPLAFRPWTVDCRMVQGMWKIPVPADGPEVLPDVLLAPTVGWDRRGFRLGYGGGYFDRTLASLARRPLTVGVGLGSAQLLTIFPQKHDIAMDVIVTDAHTFVSDEQT
jgi:5,10-methenyltetrahydrofolate synthetase